MPPPMTGDGKQLSVKVMDRRVAGEDGWATEGRRDEGGGLTLINDPREITLTRPARKGLY